MTEQDRVAKRKASPSTAAAAAADTAPKRAKVSKSVTKGQKQAEVWASLESTPMPTNQ
jgi:hypothetical protein